MGYHKINKQQIWMVTAILVKTFCKTKLSMEEKREFFFFK